MVGGNIFNGAFDTIWDCYKHTIAGSTSVQNIFICRIDNAVETRDNLTDSVGVGLQDEIFLVTYYWDIVSDYLGGDTRCFKNSIFWWLNPLEFHEIIHTGFTVLFVERSHSLVLASGTPATGTKGLEELLSLWAHQNLEEIVRRDVCTLVLVSSMIPLVRPLAAAGLGWKHHQLLTPGWFGC